MPLQGASPQRFLRRELISPPDRSAGTSETNGKCPLTRLPSHPQLLLPNRVLASPGGAAVTGLISWENLALSVHLLLSYPILSFTALDLLAQQLCWATPVPRSCLPDVNILATWPWCIPLGSESRHFPCRGGRVNYRCWGSVIKAFDQDGGRRVLVF